MESTSRPAPRYNVRSRVAANGLTWSVTEYPGADEDHYTETERCESFVAEVVRDITLIGSRQVAVRKGQLVVLWGTRTLVCRGYADLRNGETEYHGYGNGGRQAVSFFSDAEAAQHVRALRDSDGKIVKAADCEQVKGWGDRHAHMMSR